VFQTSLEAEAACAELRDIIHAEAPQDWTRADHPLLEAAVNIQEDLCILQKRGDTHALTAGVMCFPSSWDICQKVGRSISVIFAIHTYIVPESALPKDELAILAAFRPELKQ